MSDIEEDGDGKYHAVSFGWLDYFRRLPKPVWAWPGTDLWRVMVRGHGFVIEAQGSAPPITGFYTTYFVRGKNRREAAEAALRLAKRRWENSVPGAIASGDLEVEVEEVEPVEARFRWRSSAGYTFFGTG
jgi:hypothetical protein